jgi:hypothetical protein
MPAAPSLSDEDLQNVLALMKGADSVELKLTVPDSSQVSTVRTLGVDPLDAQIRQVFFFDTPNLDLSEKGVVVRARRVQGRSADTTVKLRPVQPDALPPDLRARPTFGVEVDAMPGGYVCSGSLKAKVTNDAVRAVALGDATLKKLMSKEQRTLYAEHAPEGIALDDLAMLGPVFVLKASFTPPDFGRRLVTELWLYPDGSRILELSTKCAPSEAFQVAAEAKAFLGSHGVELGGEQHTKTKAALEFYARELTAGAAVSG